MRKSLILALLSLCATSLLAQTPIQIKTLAPVGSGAYPNPAASFAVTLAPTIKGNTLIAVTSTGAITDSQNNTWSTVASGFQLAISAGGPETITLTFPQVTYAMAVFAEYPGTLALDVAAPLANGSSLTAQSNIITTMQAGDLILGYGWNSTTNYDSIAPSAGFTLESFPHNAHLEDQTQAIAGPISSGVLWSGAVNWTQGIVALKVSNQPLVWVMPGLGTATFPMNIPPACSPTDGTCSIQIQVCDTSKTPPVCMTSSQGTITLLKNVTLPTPQQQSIPLVTVTP